MSDHTHQNAPTQFVDGAGIRSAYRRFGENQGALLVFFQQFTGVMDNAGISSSGGEAPKTIAEMAQHAAAFIDALGLEQVDQAAKETRHWVEFVGAV